MRIPRLAREAATIVIMRRRFGYSINALATWLGRSTSFIQRILKFNGLTGHLSHDLRILPARVRRLNAQRLRFALLKWHRAWEAWLLSDEGEPP